MIERALKRIGLTQGEIKIYLSLLEIGSCTTGKIIKKSGISGSKVYEVLDRLAKKGLVSYITKNNVKYFEATNPERILDLLEHKHKELEEEKHDIQKIIPELLLKHSTSTKSEVRVFTGFEGAKAVFEENIRDCKKGDEMWGWGLTEQPKSWELYFNKREKYRDDKGIIHKAIINEKYHSLYNSRKDFPNTHFKFFTKKLEMPVSIMVWKNKVSLYVITKQDPLVILIESDAVADSFKKYFQELWKNAKSSIDA